MSEIVGQPLDRVDGRAKVTGTAPYAADFPLDRLTYGVTVQSTIARGSISKLDTSRAKSAPGVIAVFTHENTPSLSLTDEQRKAIKLGEDFLLPLQDNRVYYDGQHIALVVADTFERAEYAAGLLDIEYVPLTPILDLDLGLATAYKPQDSMGRPLQISRGDFDGAWSNAAVRLDQTYSTPVYNHNPMEPPATIALWDGSQMTVYDSTQSVMGNRNAIAYALGLDPGQVRLIDPFVGGGFGCKGFTWAHTLLAPMAARALGRPVKIVLTRRQMFTCIGRRAHTIQQIQMGAGADGKLVSVHHKVLTETSFVDEFIETAGLPTERLYACPNLKISHEVMRLNRGTPTPMRAPGEAPGTYALECAMDELACQLKMDPIELRLANHAETDPQNGKAWSSKNLRECYQRGAETIGWSKRNPKPQSMRDGNHFVGYGMASAIYPANRSPASARAVIYTDGHAEVESCTQDIGTGTYTIMTQIAAQALGLPVEQVQFKLGDSNLPKAPVSGGSQTAASVGPAVRQACVAAREKLLRLAATDKRSPLAGHPAEDVVVENGRCYVNGAPDSGETYAEILRRGGLASIDAEAQSHRTTRKKGGGEQEDHYAFYSFGAQFAKVLFDPFLGTVRVTHCASVMDIGRVLNLKTAANQVMGGIIFGIGMALMEQTVYDAGRGRIITRDLANYLIPVHADIPEITVDFINAPDTNFTEMGARGVGEIGITGITAAIANAVYHASGKRIRALPITPDKFLPVST